MPFVLVSDPRITSLPVTDCGHPLVDVRGYREIIIAGKRASANPGHSLVRSGTLERLLAAARSLPPNVFLCLEEGFRSLEVQKLLFNSYVAELRSQLEIKDNERLAEEATKYVARPEGAPPHSTGGAVDVTLVTRDGGELDMGSSSDDTPLMNGSLNFMHSPAVTESARQNRALLARAMAHAGFVNYPAEWWHWSYGDQYWAFRRRHKRGIYGAASTPGNGRSPNLSPL